MFLVDKVTPHLFKNNEQFEGKNSHSKRRL